MGCFLCNTGELPAATNSGSYAGYLFREDALYTALTYHNGQWYCVSAETESDVSVRYNLIWFPPIIDISYYNQQKGYVIQANLDGSDAATLEWLGMVEYAQVEGAICITAGRKICILTEFMR